MKNTINYQEYVYDVAVDGGTTTSRTLSNKANKANIPVGAVVTHVFSKVIDACVSTGSAKIQIGNTASTNKFMDVEVAVAVKDYVKGWTATDFHAVTNAATGDIVVSIGTAALTAGKIVVGVEYALPTI
jgi:hypothetical protein